MEDTKCNVPTSLNHAFKLCIQHAKDHRKLSVLNISQKMNVTADLLYKWISTGNMPIQKVVIFESVCGANFVTQWQANVSGLIAMPVVLASAKLSPAAFLDKLLNYAKNINQFQNETDVKKLEKIVRLTTEMMQLCAAQRDSTHKKIEEINASKYE